MSTKHGLPMKKYIIPLVQENLDLVIVKWLVQDGGTVEKGEHVVELECEKADVSLTAPVAGLLRHLHEVSEEVNAGQPIGEIHSHENYVHKPDDFILKRAITTLPTSKNEEFWTFNDGWILASIAIGINPDEPIQGTNLSALIQYGDFLNHAILTHNELSSSLTKLLQYGVIILREKNYDLNEEWEKKILLSVGDITPLGPITRVTKWLNDATLVKAHSRIVEVTKEELDVALEHYMKEIRSS